MLSSNSWSWIPTDLGDRMLSSSSRFWWPLQLKYDAMGTPDYMTSGFLCPNFSSSGDHTGGDGITGWMFVQQARIFIHIQPKTLRMEISDYATIIHVSSLCRHYQRVAAWRLIKSSSAIYNQNNQVWYWRAWHERYRIQISRANDLHIGKYETSHREDEEAIELGGSVASANEGRMDEQLSHITIRRNYE